MIFTILYFIGLPSVYSWLHNVIDTEMMKDYDPKHDLFGLVERERMDNTHWYVVIALMSGLFLMGCVDSLIYGFLRMVLIKLVLK